MRRLSVLRCNYILILVCRSLSYVHVHFPCVFPCVFRVMEVLKFLESKRGGRMVIYKHFKFNFGSTNKKDGSTRWRCVTRTCDAKLYTDKNDAFSSAVGEHYHNKYDELNINRQIVNTACKRKAIEDLNTRPKKIILKEIAQNDATSYLNVHDIKRLRNNMYKYRAKVLPPNPTNINEVHQYIAGAKIKTVRNEHFVLDNDENKNVIIFSCEKNLHFLSHVENVYVDGTFKYSARFFEQMFTIHGYKNGHYIPLVFCLLVNKSVQTYEFLFKKITDKCNSLGLRLSPLKCTVDFEYAIHKAIQTVWPNTEIIGCRFHVTQSWWRNVQQFGLATHYKDNTSDIGKWIHYTFGLLFLNPEEVGDCFVEDLMTDCPVNDKLQKYCDYLTDNYISDESIFPPKIWAANSSDLIRTTNACESFHSFFNKSFYCNSPSIGTWLAVIQEVQTDVYIKLNSIHLQNSPKDRKVKDRQLKNEDKIQQYNRGEISRYAFLKSISFNYTKNLNLN